MVINLNNEKEHYSRTTQDKFGYYKFNEKIVDCDDDWESYLDNTNNHKVGTMEIKTPNNFDSCPQT